VAVASNLNPGTSMSENVFLALGLACVENGLTPAEAYLGFTRVAGEVLGQPPLGRLRVGGPADLVVYAAESYRQLPYHFAMNDVAAVVKAGRQVVGA
jgi:imidazolonepropionase